MSHPRNSSGQTISIRRPPHHQTSSGNRSGGGNVLQFRSICQSAWPCWSESHVCVQLSFLDSPFGLERNQPQQKQKYMHDTTGALPPPKLPKPTITLQHCFCVRTFFVAHCVLQSTKVSWTQGVAFSKAVRCTETGRSSSCMSSRSSSGKSYGRSCKRQ